MKKLLPCLLALLLLAACGGPAEGSAGQENTNPNTTEVTAMPALTLTANGQRWSVTLSDSPAAQALVDQLPLTLEMAELNGNEKYASLPAALPVQASCPGQIQAGDVMLYGKDCLVLFYESFSTSYSYTPLGRLDDPQGLAQALGTGGVTVTLTLSS